MFLGLMFLVDVIANNAVGQQNLGVHGWYSTSTSISELSCVGKWLNVLVMMSRAEKISWTHCLVCYHVHLQ